MTTSLICRFCGHDADGEVELSLLDGRGVPIPHCIDIKACIRRSPAEVADHRYGSEMIKQGPRDWRTGP